MKRKITELEERLIASGYYLSFKNYQGKRSEKTMSYTYVKGDMFVELDQKRESIINYGLLNVNYPAFTLLELDTLKKDFDTLDTFVRNLQDEKEPVKVYAPNSEYDEREELGEMTFEQFDELCQEKESK